MTAAISWPRNGVNFYETFNVTEHFKRCCLNCGGINTAELVIDAVTTTNRIYSRIQVINFSCIAGSTLSISPIMLVYECPMTLCTTAYGKYPLSLSLLLINAISI